MCKSGGYFIGTCYDGLKIFKTFKESNKESFEMTDDFGSLIYKINKKYDIETFDYDKNNIDAMLGNEIEVYMSSIGQLIPEYLVNFAFFVDIMKEYGFTLQLPSFRRGLYNPIKDPIQSFDSIIESTSEIREKDNNFVKAIYRDLYDITKSPKLKLLSGFR